MMRRVVVVTCAVAMACGMIVPAAGQEVHFDLSNGFNWDIWCGAKEFQALMLHWQDYWGIDLVEMQGGNDEHNGPVNLLGSSHWLICEIDADLAEAMGCVQDSAGTYCGYAGPTNWWRPGYKDDTQATPADGILVGADRNYHIASHAGNSTLPGDWTEIEDTTTWTAGGLVCGTGLGLKFNVMASFTAHDTADLHDASVTAELPDQQKGYYNNVNFVLAVMDGENGGRHKRLWALYGIDGAEQELLWAWDDEAADLRPQMDAADPSVYLPTFRAINAATQCYNASSGSTGNVTTKTNRMYEFGEPFPLEPYKYLWGFKIDDSEPDTNWQARGVAVWAATAFASSRQPLPDPELSTVVADPDHTPDNGVPPAIVTVTLLDRNHAPVDYVSDHLQIGVSGTGTSTISFVAETSPGVYVYEFTNDTPGTKYLQVTYDDPCGDDDVTLNDLGVVIVFERPWWLDPVPGEDMAVEDLDESGDEAVLLDGSASTGLLPIVSYVWAWHDVVLATGETAVVTLPLGARQIDLILTDDEGYTARDSLWVEVRAKGFDPSLVQLDISGGFNVDSLWGAYEMKALYWYAWDYEPDLDGAEAQGCTVSANPLAVNPDIGWIVWSQGDACEAALVNNSRDTYTTYHQWWHPAYIDEGLPESGYLAGAQGVDYYMASSSGNPIMPGNLVCAADDFELAQQLGPGGYAVTGNGMEIVLNTMAVGCAADAAAWQKTEAYAELPVEQQTTYWAVNCVLCAFENALADRGRFMRLAAVYVDDTEEIIWAWADDQGADDTPRPSELAATHPDYNLLVQTSEYYTADSGTTGEIASRDYALYEFAAPLTLDTGKVLKGLRLYDSNPSTGGQPRGIAIFAVTGDSSPQPPRPPLVEVSTEDDLDWVYENVSISHANGSHKVGLTVNVLDLNGNDDITVTLRKKAGSGPGEVAFRDGATPLEKFIVGPDRDRANPKTGDLVIEVVCCGDWWWTETIVEVPFQVNLFGDIDANSGVEPGDASLLIKKLNANPYDPAGFSGYHLKAFDLDGNTGIEPSDLGLLLHVLNGLL